MVVRYELISGFFVVVELAGFVGVCFDGFLHNYFGCIIRQC